MATRILRQTFTNSGSDTVNSNEGPLSPPSAIKWTIVELRPAFYGAGYMDGYFDTEKYHTIDSNDVDQYGKPHVIALDVVQPHQYKLQLTDTSGSGGTNIVDVVIEESPQSGTQ
jgi:hypothetical protein